MTKLKPIAEITHDFIHIVSQNHKILPTIINPPISYYTNFYKGISVIIIIWMKIIVLQPSRINQNKYKLDRRNCVNLEASDLKLNPCASQLNIYTWSYNMLRKNKIHYTTHRMLYPINSRTHIWFNGQFFFSPVAPKAWNLSSTIII